MPAQNITINLKTNTDELKPAEDALDSIAKKGGEVGAIWKKTSEQIDKSTQTNIDGNNKLAASIDALGVAAKSADKVIIGGAYKQYLKEIQSQLGLTNKELIAYVQNARKAAQQSVITAANDQEAKEFTTSIKIMNDVLKDLGVNADNTTEKTQRFTSQIRDMKDELLRLAAAGQENTPAFQELQAQVVHTEEKVRLLNKTVANAGSETKNIDSLISLARGVAAGFEIAEGAAAVFGLGEEDVHKALLKVNAAMAILQGLQEISEVLNKSSAASLLFKANAQEIDTAATVEGTVAQEGLNAAMEANPIGLLVIGITAVITALSIFSDHAETSEKKTKALEESTKALTDAYEKLAKINEGTNEQPIEVLEKQLDLAKQQTQSTSNILKLENDILQAKLKNNGVGFLTLKDTRSEADALAVVNGSIADSKKNLEDVTKLIEKIHDRGDTSIKIVDPKTGLVVKKTLEDLNKQVEEYNKQYVTGQAVLQQYYDLQSQLAQNAAEQIKHELEQQEKDSIGAAEADVARKKTLIIKNQVDTIKSIRDVTDAEIAAINVRAAAASNIKLHPDLTAGELDSIEANRALAVTEQYKALQLKLLEVDKSTIAARVSLSVAGSQQEYENQVDLLHKELQIQLAQVDVTNAKKKELEAQVDVTNGKKKELEAKFQNDLHQLAVKRNIADLDDEISYIDVKLAVFGTGEDKKLDLTLERLNLEQNKEIEGAEKNGAKIAAINAKYDGLIRAARLASIQAVEQKQLAAFDAVKDQEIKFYERIAGDTDLSDNQRDAAIEHNRQIAQARLQIEFNSLEQQKGLIADYNVKYQELANKRNDIDQVAADKTFAIQAAAIDKTTQKLAASFALIAKGATDVLGTNALSTGIAAFGTAAAAIIGDYQKMTAAVKKYDDIIKSSTASQAEKDEATKAKAKLQIQNIKDIAVAAIQAFQQVSDQIFADGAAKRAAALEKQIADLEAARNQEVNVENLSKQQIADINRRFDDKETLLKRQAFEADKRAKKSQALINGALAITLAFAEYVYPYNLIVAGITAALTAVEISQINAQTPGFKKGKIAIDGPGTETSDSINARLSKGESVITAQKTREHKEPLTAIHEGWFDSWLDDHFQKFYEPHVPDNITYEAATGTISIDYEKVGDSIANKIAKKLPAPMTLTNVWDKHGYSLYLDKENSRTKFLNNRFSMP